MLMSPLFFRFLPVARRALGALRSLRLPRLAGVLIATVLAPAVARAQWVNESYVVKAGWNAIWIPLDLSHLTIDEALANRATVEEVWRWNPASGPQFVSSPVTPVQANPAWNVWKRGLPLESTLFTFTPNAAYLVKVRDGTSNVTITLRGRPVPPDYPWSTSGINLVGFPTESTPPTFSNFLSYGAAFAAEPAILAYVGGALSNTAPKNPVAIIASTEPVTRGSAFWIQATQYTDYYGPVVVQVAERSGLNFGRSRVSISVRLKNVAPAAKAQNVVVTLASLTSAAPPAIPAGTATMGTGASAGRVISIAPDLNSSLTYATPPEVTISAPAAGTTATATAVLNSSGRIVSFNVTNGGAGYGATTPTVSVTPTISGRVPLKIRGDFDPITSQYSYTSLNTAQTLTLAPGQETEVVLVADRATMGATPGALFGSILRITDSLGLTRINLPVTAVSGDFTGLWTGAAALNLVDQIENQNVVAAAPVVATAAVTSGAVTFVEVNSSHAYFHSVPSVGFTGGGGSGATATAVLTKNILTGITVTAGGSGYTSAPTVTFTGGQVDVRATASTMPLRLIVHRSASGEVRLLQQAYVGTDGVATTIATAESHFPSNVKPSGRISSAQFPSDLDNKGTGTLSANGSVSFDVTLGYNADTNPFVHRYHPDHDNLDSRFETVLPAGRESHTVRRVITLAFTPTLPGIDDPAWGVTMLGGNYTETVTGLRSVPITVGGTFVLYRVSEGPTLLPP